MGRTLQKKKNKSGIARVTRKPKSKKSLLLSNQLIAASWDKTQTLAQNYRRLGLANRLNGHTGGVDRHALLPSSSLSASTTLNNATSTEEAELAAGTAGVLDIKRLKRRTAAQINHSEARIERDTKTGVILRVLDEEFSGFDDDDSGEEAPEAQKIITKSFTPLHDPLSRFDDTTSTSTSTRNPSSINISTPHHSSGHIGDTKATKNEFTNTGDFLAKLEADAAKPGGKKVRKQSQREEEWCGRLVERWGRDWSGMSKDAELNVMQQSEGDVRRRVERWLKGRAEVVEA